MKTTIRRLYRLISGRKLSNTSFNITFDCYHKRGERNELVRVLIPNVQLKREITYDTLHDNYKQVTWSVESIGNLKYIDLENRDAIPLWRNSSHILNSYGRREVNRFVIKILNELIYRLNMNKNSERHILNEILDTPERQLNSHPILRY